VRADPPAQSPLTRLSKYDTVFRHAHHEGDAVLTNPSSPKISHAQRHMPMHDHPFSVHGTSSTHTALGHSDVFRHAESTNPRFVLKTPLQFIIYINIRYETESMHMQSRDAMAATSESVPADSSASSKPHIDSLPHFPHIIFRKKHPANFESERESAAWARMSEALQTLIDKG
jgi:hypothetical protein